MSVEELLSEVIGVLAGAMTDRDPTGKADRLAEYADLRAAGVGKGEAAWRVGVGPETARRYEIEIRKASR